MIRIFLKEMEFIKSEKLLQMLYLLLEGNKLSAQALANKLEVSTRTVYRYVESLSQAGFPIYVLKGRNGGITLMPQFKLNNALVNKDEQADILASLQSMRALNTNDSQTLEKLAAVFGQDPVSWIKIDPTAWNDNGLQKDSLSLLRDAILQEKFVSFNYINAKNEYQKRLVYPNQVIFKNQVWYLWGYSMERQAERLFKLARIDQLTLADTPETNGKTPWKTDKLEQSKQIQQIEVQLFFDKSLRYRIYEEFPRDNISTESDGFLVQTRLNDDEWVITYLMSFGSKLKVLAPESLKTKVKREIEKTLENY